jgi:hypothetical protein
MDEKRPNLASEDFEHLRRSRAGKNSGTSDAQVVPDSEWERQRALPRFALSRSAL